MRDIGRQAGRQVMATKSHAAAALDELQAERMHLAARLAKVDALIASFRDVFHLTAGKPGPAAARPRRVAAASTNGNGHHHSAAIRAALQAGPLSPGVLSAQLGIERAKLRTLVKQLENEGVVMTSGTTASRQIALAGRPAKEAP